MTEAAVSSIDGSQAHDPEVYQGLGLTDSEYQQICDTLNRHPNHLELAMYSVMWSEHCSYKSSRIHLKRFPTKAPWVLVGPGEGAGVVDVGDGIAVALRIESHNHPSAIEPYEGAATGVGGILRDIFSMGARPIAVMDPLRFGPLDDARSRWVAEGVVSGVSGYGNAVGVPNVGGETVFDETFIDNPLVNVLALGIMPKERLVLGRAEGEGNLAILLGSGTGRDGIGGVSVLASAGFDEEMDEDKRPSVQVGDPYEEKRLIEACLELLEKQLAVGVQDLGGGGITCATSETAAAAGSGMDVWVSEIHTREDGMEPFEIMISESQERMLAIVKPENVDAVFDIAKRWEIQANIIGKVTTTGQLRILDRPDGEVIGDVPAISLEDEAPKYDRERREPADLAERQAVTVGETDKLGIGPALLDMLMDTSWVYDQYDSQLFLNTVESPGGDAAVLRLKDPSTGADTGRGMALTTDGNHLWNAVDPYRAGEMTVAESVMNLAVVGARPIAMVNCLNFGNPEHPEVMWQLSQSVDGLTSGLNAFGIPCIGGNVSLYNESRGVNIDPAPVIGVLGTIDKLERRAPGVNLVDGARLILVGETDANLSGSLWAKLAGERGLGTLPEVDLDAVAKVAGVVRDLVNAGHVLGAHDVAEGGLGLALAEMAAKSGLGVVAARIADHRELFSESSGRAVLAVSGDSVRTVLDELEALGVPHERIGVAGGDRFTVKDLVDLPLADIISTYKSRLPEALGAGTTQG